MSPEHFEHFLAMVDQLISKNEICFRKCISAAEKLLLTLRFYITHSMEMPASFSYLHLYIPLCMKSNFSATSLHAFLVALRSLYDILFLS